MRIARTLSVVIALSTGWSVPALALSYKDIAGKWCSDSTNYRFERSALTVTFLNGSPTKVFKITRYQYHDGEVIIHWLRNSEKLWTKFGEFSGDGRNMAQQKNGNGPRRPFRRC